MQKKGPKKGPSTMKKEEIIEYNPIKINDIKLSNMDLSINYPSDSKWIASQLQIIKDRNIYDCYTNKPIWTKIYPQQCGLPVYNNSGRYWIVEEDKKRIELITHQPIQYNFFRIKTGVSKVPLLNMFSPFSFEEIHTAKTCIKNRLHKPPNYQDGAEIRDDGKSIMSTIQKNNAEESLQMKPLDDFSSLANIIESLNRGIGGIWISDNDILKNFEHIQLFYNPNKYPHNKIINVGQSSEYELTIGEEYEVLIIDQNLNNNNEQNDFNEENEENNVLFSFSSKECKNQKIIPQPYCILQKFDFQNFQVVHEYQPIRGNQNSQLIQIENKNQIFKILCYTPVSYTLNISSSNPFRLCSMLQFLQEFEGFQVKNFTIEYPAFEKNKEEVFILKLKSQNDQLLKYMHLKLIENDQKNDSQMLNTIEGVDKNLYENTLQISNYMRIQIKAKTSYFLILEGELPHNVSEGNVQVEFYTKNNDIQFENYEHVEPLVYQEKYFPTKYGILFREKLYVQEDTLVSLRLKIGEVLGNNNNIQQQSIDPKKKGKINNINEQTEIQERDLVEKRLIKMELFENGKSIIYSNGYNVTHFSNVFLKSTKNNENVQYLIQAIFDLRDWPNAKYINEDTENIFWFLSVISTSTVAFVKDTDKEDKDKTIKKSWEDKEQGRAEKAKKARKKYEILIKKQQNPNIELTEEEQQLIQEVRLSKKQREEQQQSIGNIGKKQVKKEDKKNTKGQKKEDIIDDKKEIKQFPKSNDHQTQDICEFLQHLEQPRIIEKLADHGGLIDIRSSQNKQEIKENALLSLEEFTGFNQRNELLNNELKQLQNEEYQKIMSLYQQDRTNFKQNWVSFLEQRDEFKTKNQVKNSKEKELIEVLKQEKPQVNVTDFEKLLVDIQEINDFNVQLVNLGKLVLKNLKIQVLSNKIEECLGIFNVDLLKEYMSEYKNYQVQGINQEIIQKAEEMLEEARQNPNFVVEKQAEAKKAGKKGKNDFILFLIILLILIKYKYQYQQIHILIYQQFKFN
ncbi:hypothetical protein IMG5_052980 [Ichthyophthirius multifiliis]|uniref:Uncharacterized protein n=1 Tax=Ichthyophthirius multifiliis TaxID=5932 RepID=G0QMW5_ICHMU|nr:hypothetical protein IMG5_052980 [Ichthyophthirius multifiliis]EGR33436.1 hypothetical protein IMG5_052980 [Ichthyophthirius multifiliis]|eukprot:XP_004037422.1 hypothetical protein IMG5_052980 [Ichthyophthirius multifiliis]